MEHKEAGDYILRIFLGEIAREKGEEGRFFGIVGLEDHFDTLVDILNMAIPTLFLILWYKTITISERS